jgi:(1->4)-alpha-D-glucan 1-alpha-D-glucosylmutase
MPASPLRASAPVVSTYRLQLHPGFGLRDAERLVPYLADLGVSHVYCSPYLRARQGSAHGYDVIDHDALNPELGEEADLVRFVQTLRSHGMGQIFDFVVNHVGIGGGENAWWWDVLEHGRDSPYADFFDVDWDPPDGELRGKVLLPRLAAPYRDVLEAGELGLAFDAASGGLRVTYRGESFPVSPREYPRVLQPALRALTGLASDSETRGAAELRETVEAFRCLPVSTATSVERAQLRQRAAAARRALAELCRAEPVVTRHLQAALRRFDGSSGDPDAIRELHQLLEAQSYRLAFWRRADTAINYRRFFDVNDLAGVRVERDAVFERVHRRVFHWIEEGKLDGLRIDHIDGLHDPGRYLERIRERFPSNRLYLILEKILGPEELLPAEWPVDGTTGYDFLNLVNGLFVDPGAEAQLDRLHREFTGRGDSFDAVLDASKRHVAEALFGGELWALARHFHALAHDCGRGRGLSQSRFEQLLTDVVVGFEVYRTYVSERGASSSDARRISRAVEWARGRSAEPEPGLLSWVEQVLLGEPPAPADRPRAHRVAAKLQQLTGPVMAKGLEDTAFYRHFRLASQNEVGGDPRRFGVSTAEFHRANLERSLRAPRSMLATATHDTKQGEDARARIDVISELPGEWERKVWRWADLNARFKTSLHGATAPTPSHEYLLYQTLVGSWPPPAALPRELPAFRDRIEAFMIKAVRQGKEQSSWRRPEPAYEEAVTKFVRRVLEPAESEVFLADLARFARRIATLGTANGLAQLAFKICAPGVPDVYQGCELWDLSLVDPDNRRPVDFEHRRRLLTELREEFADLESRGPEVWLRLVEDWQDGRIKLFVTWKLLRLRREEPRLFLEGRYLPLSVSGDRAPHACAFARQLSGPTLIVAAPRLCAGLPGADSHLPVGAATWGDTRVQCPDDGATWYRHVLTGARIPVRREGPAPALAASDLFADLPVGVALAKQPGHA